MVTPQEKAGVGCSGGGGWPAGGGTIRGVGCTAQPEGFASEEEVGWKELRLYLVGATAVDQWLAVSAAVRREVGRAQRREQG